MEFKDARETTFGGDEGGFQDGVNRELTKQVVHDRMKQREKIKVFYESLWNLLKGFDCPTSGDLFEPEEVVKARNLFHQIRDGLGRMVVMAKAYQENDKAKIKRMYIEEEKDGPI